MFQPESNARFANANRPSGFVDGANEPGRSGNEVLTDTLAAMKAEGISGRSTRNPIGDHGHGAGPLIGLWDRQQGRARPRRRIVLPGTWFSIELSATTPVREWGGKELGSARKKTR